MNVAIQMLEAPVSLLKSGASSGFTSDLATCASSNRRLATLHSFMCEPHKPRMD
jgi:hypothetical protein